MTLPVQPPLPALHDQGFTLHQLSLYDTVILPHGRPFTKGSYPMPPGYVHRFAGTARLGAVKVDIYFIQEDSCPEKKA